MNYFKDYNITDFCYFLIGLGDEELNYESISKLEMYDFLQGITNNFELIRFNYCIEDLRESASVIEFYENIENPEPMVINMDTGYPDDNDYQAIITKRYTISNLIDKPIFNKKENLQERIKRIENGIEKENHTFLLSTSAPLIKLFEFSDIAENEYKRVCETATPEPEPTLIGIKRPANTHNQQFALLESLGVIDYLKKEYPTLPGIKMSELIANIINKDVQNTRTMLSMSGTKNQESNLPKNQKVINDILIKSGIIQKD